MTTRIQLSKLGVDAETMNLSARFVSVEMMTVLGRGGLGKSNGLAVSVAKSVRIE